eukprot:TRINITY_DN341_c0_g1_i1.p1 TRINITY_DN341_c0_g1~~TRINITY_DN341_c0_g1_i1.p1  ORF type:complete len:60 (+),score=0.99 TRINITY_DN341_c0_g1_i1:62-241(+)
MYHAHAYRHMKALCVPVVGALLHHCRDLPGIPYEVLDTAGKKARRQTDRQTDTVDVAFT